MATLHGWHQGERAIQQRLHHDLAVTTAYTNIQTILPDQHKTFHTARLPFLPVTTLDTDGRPWGSIFSAADGKPGFIRASDYNTLTMEIDSWEGDPFWEHGGSGRSTLAAGIGIEFSTRRRNKLAGKLARVEREGVHFSLTLAVAQAIGNCPKYINVRDLIPQRSTPKLAMKVLHVGANERLPDDVIAFVHCADTVFIGTSYVAPPGDAAMFPSHVGMNQRGGRQGFVRVRPSDHRTVVLPDFSGNRLLTSLGNIEITPLASLTFVDFVTGDILYLTGDAETLTGKEAQAIMPFQTTLTTIFVTGYSLVKNALPVRQREGTEVERSPYSPPIRLLAEEVSSGTLFNVDERVTVQLSRIDVLSPSLARFTWTTSKSIRIKPGQAAVMDFKDLLGTVGYQHMAQLNPTSVNDDRIRTWTVSSSHPDETTTFELTMREKEDGVVTGALFNIVRKLEAARPELLANATPLQLSVKLVGIVGDFVLPERPRKLLWIAGGIGLTPFLSMLKSFLGSEDDIQLVLATREPDVLLPLLAVEGSPKLRIDVFSGLQPRCTVHRMNYHQGRLPDTFFDANMVQDREIYVCGPDKFEKDVLAGLKRVGVKGEGVHREGFGY